MPRHDHDVGEDAARPPPGVLVETEPGGVGGRACDWIRQPRSCGWSRPRLGQPSSRRGDVFDEQVAVGAARRCASLATSGLPSIHRLDAGADPAGDARKLYIQVGASRTRYLPTHAVLSAGTLTRRRAAPSCSVLISGPHRPSRCHRSVRCRIRRFPTAPHQFPTAPHRGQPPGRGGGPGVIQQGSQRGAAVVRAAEGRGTKQHGKPLGVDPCNTARWLSVWGARWS